MLDDLKNDNSSGAAKLIDKAIDIIRCQLNPIIDRETIRKFLKKVKKELLIDWFSNFLKYNG
jgi:hypothetical protein